VAIVAAALVVAACGKKGPPLAPLQISPEAPTAATAVRLANDVHLRFTLPSKNSGNVQGPVDLARMEIYAASVAAGAPAPPNREFLTPKFLVATIDVRPAAVEGEPAAEPAAPDTRPGPGDVATFVEKLTDAMLTPTPPPAPAAGSPAAAKAAAAAAIAEAAPPAGATPTPAQAAAIAAAAAQAPPKYPTRIYAVRGVTRRGRPGSPTTRLTVPLVAPPAPPSDVTADFTETAVTLKWTPTPAAEGTTAAAFNVYEPGKPGIAPLTASPLTTPSYERPGVEFGVEQCFTVRSVARVGDVPIESEPSTPACVTPNDKFPPAAPVDLQAVSSGGVVALIWNANTEADLAGYIVLRGEAAGGTLQALTATPIRETVYRDTTVKPGVRYAYAVVAVDRAAPPNTSAQSARVEVTASQ
jgi:hypothetical protein